MTVHDFIVVYNETFKYIEKKYGIEAVIDLWSTIRQQWCTHLKELVKEKGLEGMLEYWGGDTGTLRQEKADFNVSLENGIFRGEMIKCPSVDELRIRGRKVYKGELNYCDHCRYLYTPIAREYGFEMLWNIQLDESGECSGRCTWIAYNKDEYKSIT